MKLNFGIRVWILIIALILAVIAIHPNFFAHGVTVASINSSSDLFNQGLKVGDVITSVNGVTINNKEDYGGVVESLFKSANGTGQRIDITANNQVYTIFTNQSLPITVNNVPITNIRTGLDLRGGARALVTANATLTTADLNNLIAVTRNRFNVFGLSDIQVQGVTDLSGNKYMLIEVAGATPDNLRELISKQGVFEGKIGNDTVFTGGKGDISDVCRNDATCSGVTSCTNTQGIYVCDFQFTIYLTPSAAQRQADLTRNLSLDSAGQYLSKKLDLYIDNRLEDSLSISSDLRGQITTQISIQGSGNGTTQQNALTDAKAQMNRLQTILITGSLPYKLKIVKLDTISPLLGSEFTEAILIAGVAAILLVSLIIFIRYRKFKASLALLLTSFSEIVIILGVAALIKWNLDLASIAGILATIGTGVDDQIVILDESIREKFVGLKERIKRAFFIIFGSYATVFVSLIPLYWAGAGLFKGFAFTTIIGITAGVLITRPAFAEIVRKVLK